MSWALGYWVREVIVARVGIAETLLRLRVLCYEKLCWNVEQPGPTVTKPRPHPHSTLRPLV